VTEQRIRLLDDLGAEFARVAEEHETASRRFVPPRGWRTRRPATRRGGVALALVVTVLLASGGAYAVPVTRSAIEDVTGSFAGWAAGDEEQAPGRALRTEDDAPAWVRERGGRLIAETDGVGLYVTRTKSQDGSTLLMFALGKGIGLGDSIEGWRKRFDEHAVVVLGPTPVRGRPWDRRGRFPLLGVTARSVDRVELRYATGPPLVAGGVDGGFVLMVDARRALRELIAYDAADRELERTDVSHIDLRRVCSDERGCPPGRLVGP
jgi:hypothetical protein